MKTWEMIKELTENPEKEFISYEFEGGRSILKTELIDGAIRFSNEEDGWHEVLIGIDLDREWEEIKKPVDFMTAAEVGWNKVETYSKIIWYRWDEWICWNRETREFTYGLRAVRI